MHAEPGDQDFERLAEEFAPVVTRQMRRERLVGLSLAVVFRDRIVWAEGFGQANREDQIPATPQTVYEIGDISKAVTALAVLRLVEQGRLALDAEVQEILPNLTIESRFDAHGAVTVRRLLTHHGGVISNQWHGLYQPRPATELTPINAIFLGQRPGEIYAYSSLGFQLAGHVVQTVAGEPFTQFVEREVLAPLRMSNATYGATQLAASYDKRRLVAPSYPRDLAALGLQGSVTDLAQLAIAMINPDQSGFAPESIREMQRWQNRDIALDISNRTGLAWQLTNAGQYRVERLLRINNASLGYAGLLLIAPEEQVAVALLSNAANAFQDTVDIGQDLFDAAIETATGRTPPNRDDFELRPAPMPAIAQRAPMARMYATAFGAIEFERDGDERFDLRFLGRNFRAIEQPSGWYVLRYRLLRILSLSPGILDEVMIRPARIADRDVLLAQYRDNVFTFGTRFDPARPSPNLTALEGRYRLQNPDWLSDKLEIEEVRVRAEEEGLYATYRLPFFFRLTPRIPLVPMDESRLVIPGLGTNLGEPVTIERAGDRVSLTYAGYRFTRD